MNDCIAALVEREGGYDIFTDRPSDRGGPTRAGITLPTLSCWLGHPATADELKALTHEQIHQLYANLFYAPFAEITDEKLRTFLFDYAVNSGVTAVIHVLQHCLNVPVDGELGPKTLAAAGAADPHALFSCVFQDRLARFLHLALGESDVHAFLIAHPQSQLWNLAGWTRRLAEFI